MGVLIGLVVTLGCVLGGYMAMGGYISVLNQPWEFVIIGGAALGHISGRQSNGDREGCRKGDWRDHKGEDSQRYRLHGTAGAALRDPARGEKQTKKRS